MTTITTTIDRMTVHQFNETRIIEEQQTAFDWCSARLGRTIVLSAGAITANTAVAQEVNEGMAIASIASAVLIQGLKIRQAKNPRNAAVVPKTMDELWTDAMQDMLVDGDKNTSNPTFVLSNTAPTVHWRD